MPGVFTNQDHKGSVGKESEHHSCENDRDCVPSPVHPETSAPSPVYEVSNFEESREDHWGSSCYSVNSDQEGHVMKSIIRPFKRPKE